MSRGGGGEFQCVGVQKIVFHEKLFTFGKILSSFQCYALVLSEVTAQNHSSSRRVNKMCIIPRHIPKTLSTIAIYYFQQYLNITTMKHKCCQLCKEFNAHWQSAIPTTLNCHSFYYRSTSTICRAKCALRNANAAPSELEKKDENYGYAGESRGGGGGGGKKEMGRGKMEAK